MAGGAGMNGQYPNDGVVNDGVAERPARPDLATFAGLHAWLTTGCGLVSEPAHGGSWRSYFAGTVEWHPARSTRVLKVLLDSAGAPFAVQLCVSSDRNNSVLLHPPFAPDALRDAIDAETRRLMCR
jgi:hypothetical protein